MRRHNASISLDNFVAFLAYFFVALLERMAFHKGQLKMLLFTMYFTMSTHSSWTLRININVGKWSIYTATNCSKLFLNFHFNSDSTV